MWWLLGGRAGVAARRGHLGPKQSQMPRGVVGAQTAWCRSHVTRDRGFVRWCVLVCVCVCVCVRMCVCVHAQVVKTTTVLSVAFAP